MKNLSGIISIISLAAVIYLFIEVQSLKKEDTTVSQNLPEALQPNTEDSSSELRIAYIDLEKLLSEYEYSKELNEKMMGMLERSRANLKAETDKFQSDYQKFESKARSGAFLSQSSMENQQAELIERQQKLQEKQYQLENELMEEQTKVENQLYLEIVKHLHSIRTDYNFQYILSQVPGSDVLVADSTLNITDLVLEKLNTEYKLNQEK